MIYLIKNKFKIKYLLINHYIGLKDNTYLIGLFT